MEQSSNNSSHTNAEEQNNSKSGEELVKREPIDQSPFWAINEGKGWILVMGKYKIREEVNDLEKLKKELKKTDWNTIGKMIGVIVNDMLEHREFEKKEEEQLAKQRGE